MDIKSLLNPTGVGDERSDGAPASSPPSLLTARPFAPVSSVFAPAVSYSSPSFLSVLPKAEPREHEVARRRTMAMGTPPTGSSSFLSSAPSGPRPPSSTTTATTTPATTSVGPADRASRPARPRKDAAVFIERLTDGPVNFPPFEGVHGSLRAEIEKFSVFPLGNIYRFPRRIPYKGVANPNKSIVRSTGREAFEVFQYTFKIPGRDLEYVVLWDYNIGLVRVTPFFKALDHRKTIPGKALQVHPDLPALCLSITGGALAAQGYWLPYAAARELATTFCYPIRFALVPVFGYDFPEACVPGTSPSFGVFRVSDATIAHCRAEAQRYRRSQEAQPVAVTFGPARPLVPRAAARSFSGPESLPGSYPYPGSANWPGLNAPFPFPPSPLRSSRPHHHHHHQGPTAPMFRQHMGQPCGSVPRTLPPPPPPLPPARTMARPALPPPASSRWFSAGSVAGQKREFSATQAETPASRPAPIVLPPPLSFAPASFAQSSSMPPPPSALGTTGAPTPSRFAPGFSFGLRLPEPLPPRRVSSDVSPRTIPAGSEDRSSGGFYHRSLVQGGLSFVRGDRVVSEGSRPLSHEEGAQVLSELGGGKKARRL